MTRFLSDGETRVRQSAHSTLRTLLERGHFARGLVAAGAVTPLITQLANLTGRVTSGTATPAHRVNIASRVWALRVMSDTGSIDAANAARVTDQLIWLLQDSETELAVKADAIAALANLLVHGAAQKVALDHKASFEVLVGQVRGNVVRADDARMCELDVAMRGSASKILKLLAARKENLARLLAAIRINTGRAIGRGGVVMPGELERANAEAIQDFIASSGLCDLSAVERGRLEEALTRAKDEYDEDARSAISDPESECEEGGGGGYPSAVERRDSTAVVSGRRDSMAGLMGEGAERQRFLRETVFAVMAASKVPFDGSKEPAVQVAVPAEKPSVRRRKTSNQKKGAIALRGLVAVGTFMKTGLGTGNVTKRVGDHRAKVSVDVAP